METKFLRRMRVKLMFFFKIIIRSIKKNSSVWRIKTTNINIWIVRWKSLHIENDIHFKGSPFLGFCTLGSCPRLLTCFTNGMFLFYQNLILSRLWLSLLLLALLSITHKSFLFRDMLLFKKEVVKLWELSCLSSGE